MEPEKYCEKHFPEFVETLKELVRIPSVSFDGFDPKTVDQSAEAVAQLLRETGLENVEILRLEGAHPYVYGDWLHQPGKPTLLLYAHHDVQPPGREEVWNSNPFEPEERDGRLFGRGAADDKAGILVHVAAIASYLNTVGKLPLNVKLLVEGEEEIGSGHLETFLSRYRDKMQADCMILTDTANFDVGIPTITTSLRGMAAVDVTVKTMKQPLHSGMWGGPGPDPVLALSKMLAALMDDEGRIQIPHFYDHVRPLNKKEKESLEGLGYTDEDFRKHTGLVPSAAILGGPANAQEKLTRLPSLAVNAIQASSKKDVANVVLHEAWCRVGIRTVPDMDDRGALDSLKAFLKDKAPWGVEVEFANEMVGPWWITEPEGVAFDKAAESLERAFGRPTVFMGLGGSIPFVGPFAQVLGGVPALLVGVEDPYTNAHSENESVHLGDLRKSMVGAIDFYRNFAEE